MSVCRTIGEFMTVIGHNIRWTPNNRRAELIWCELCRMNKLCKLCDLNQLNKYQRNIHVMFINSIQLYQLTFLCKILLSLFFSNFHIVGFCPLFMLWDFVRMDFVLWDSVPDSLSGSPLSSRSVVDCMVLSCSILLTSKLLHITSSSTSNLQ